MFSVADTRGSDWFADLPAVPMNMVLEKAMLPDIRTIKVKIQGLLNS
jgi:hypothetical protein